jgi:peptide deformylase
MKYLENIRLNIEKEIHRITKLSKEQKWLPEGCLSVRWLYGKVKRSLKRLYRSIM